MKKCYWIILGSLLASSQIANADVNISNTTSAPVDLLLYINNWVVEDIIPPFSTKHELTPTGFNYVNYEAYFVKFQDTSCHGKVNISEILVISTDKNPVDQSSKISCS